MATTFTFPEIVEYTESNEFEYLSASVSQNVAYDAELTGSLDFATLFASTGVASRVTISSANLRDAAKASLATELDARLQDQFVAVGLEDDDFPSGTTPEIGETEVAPTFKDAVDSVLAAKGADLEKILFAQLVKLDSRITVENVDAYTFPPELISEFVMIVRVRMETTLNAVLPSGAAASTQDASGNLVANIAAGGNITVASPHRTYKLRITNTSTASASTPLAVAAGPNSGLGPIGTTTYSA
jgi:hypothetical protein